MEVYTTTKVKHNKPDIMLWKNEEKTCQLVECTVPLDINLADAYHQKEIKYIPLISELQRMYHGYKFSTVIITTGALGAVPKSLATNQPWKDAFKQGQDRIYNSETATSSTYRDLESLQNSIENVELTPYIYQTHL